MTHSQSARMPDRTGPREEERASASRDGPEDEPHGVDRYGQPTPGAPIDIDPEESGEPAVAIEKAEEEALLAVARKARRGPEGI
ncbi:hypothetical protein [Flavisphingomonas formosensis]|uniref:hypothetical protein n=1 Tax=Flavisphingomonas formosensis TaxID=861534 RepID=UPI0012F823BD|nr:hypothetical protein [Sphingomonas formosensis]